MKLAAPMPTYPPSYLYTSKYREPKIAFYGLRAKLSARIGSTALRPFLEFGVRLRVYDVCRDPTSCFE